jgi:hypothetical protein
MNLTNYNNIFLTTFVDKGFCTIFEDISDTAFDQSLVYVAKDFVVLCQW